jgi:transposase-like protein
LFVIENAVRAIGAAMRTEEFQALAEGLDQLMPHQRTLLIERLQKIGHVQAVVWAKPACPKCGHNEIARWGSASGLQHYRCAACKATFNALTGTPLARLRHHDTAFRWRHRFLTRPDPQKATNLAGIAEADETFFLESFRGKKQGRVRAPRKRGGKASKRGLSDEHIPVLMGRDRTGNTTDFVL